MREDPASELGRLINLPATDPATSSDADVNSALAYFGVKGTALATQWASLTAQQPLAWNELLYNAARDQSQFNITNDTQSHSDLSFGGYGAGGGYSKGENVFVAAESAFYGHAAFVIDWTNITPTNQPAFCSSSPGSCDADGDGMQDGLGHRNNIMGAFREVGIGILTSIPPGNTTATGPLVVTHALGTRTSIGDPYLLGVVFTDANADTFYTNGEGEGGVLVTVEGVGGTATPVMNTATTMDAGAYQLQVAPGTYRVTFSGGGLPDTLVAENVQVLADTNKKVDSTDALAIANHIGVHRGDQFYLDVNGNGTWNNVAGGDAVFRFGNPGDEPIVGDWDGDGFDNIGVHRGNLFYLDVNGNGKWDSVAGGDAVFKFGNPGDQAVIGDWDGDGSDNLGFHRGDRFYLDVNGNGAWNNFAGGDASYRFGNPGDEPTAGDWNGNGTDSIGFHRGDRFYLDVNGNGAWDNVAGGDARYRFGNVGDAPIVGDWNGNGSDNIGFHRGDRFYLDVNGNGAWDHFAGGDAYYRFGNTTGDIGIAGNWKLAAPLLATGEAIEASDRFASLTVAEVTPIIAYAIDLWNTTGLSTLQVQSLAQLTVRVADLPGARLGDAIGTTVTLDINAAGYGWFIDATPWDDSEFLSDALFLESDARFQMDLLTAVMHELGHVLGYGHDDEFDVLLETLATGVRRSL